MGNFAIALSGLEANSIALNTIGNNLANLNTTAYKGQATSFEDLFYQQIGQSGAGNALQVGAGTRVSGTAADFDQGTILPDINTDTPDMALAGAGFFMVEQGGQQALTRAGNFQVANNGDLITQEGQQVLGYPAQNQPPKATQNFSFSGNLDSTAAPATSFSSQVQVFDSLGNSHILTVTYSRTVNVPLNAWDFSVSLPAGDVAGPQPNNTGTLFFDSAGQAVGPLLTLTFPGLADGATPLTMTWDRSGITGNAFPSTNISAAQDGNAAGKGVVNTNTTPQPITLPVGSTESAQSTKNISVEVNLNSDAAIGSTFSTPVTVFDSLGQSHQATITYNKTNTNTWSYAITLPLGEATGSSVNNTGTLTFDSNGNLTSPAGTIGGISFSGMKDGASDLTFNWNLNGGGSAPAITQLATSNNNGPTQQDGFASGNYTGITVDSGGVITAQFSNGHQQTVGQIAVASVANEQGLIATGDNDFQTTAASGQAAAGIAGTGGRGLVEGGALEQSNVSIATEFANLIIAQRAFEADSKTMTTFDTISKDSISMVS